MTSDLSDLTKQQLIALLELPDHLRRTMIALIELGEASAGVVAKRTGRTRGHESVYLNQLVRLGYLTRSKRGRLVVFSRR